MPVAPVIVPVVSDGSASNISGGDIILCIIIAIMFLIGFMFCIPLFEAIMESIFNLSDWFWEKIL